MMLLQSIIFSAGAGTAPTSKLSPGASDTRGEITITTGDNPKPSARLFTLRFSRSRVSQTAVCMVPLSSNAKKYFLPADQSGFSVDGTFDPHETYSWRYLVGSACFDYIDSLVPHQ
jgi:hypothetical protein